MKVVRESLNNSEQIFIVGQTWLLGTNNSCQNTCQKTTNGKEKIKVRKVIFTLLGSINGVVASQYRKAFLRYTICTMITVRVRM